MFKIFYNIALIGMLGSFVIHPTTSFIDNTSHSSIVQSNKAEKEKDQKFQLQEKMKLAKEKWNKLTKQQKQEVYVLLENELKAENALTDKLVELSVISSEDAKFIKDKRITEFNQIKEKGEFPYRWNHKKPRN
jgi:hypothetical protein